MNIEPFLEAVTRFTMAQKTEKKSNRNGAKKEREKRNLYILYIQNYIVDTEW